MKDGKILLCYESNNGKYIIPGGGAEGEETFLQCCEREMLEETGIKVKPLKHLLDIEEYFDVRKHINHYYVCEETEDTGCRHLTEGEKQAGYVCVWKTPEEVLDIFGKYEDYHSNDIPVYGLYKREYAAIKEFMEEYR